MEAESRFLSQLVEKCYTDDTLRLLELELLYKDPQRLCSVLRSHAQTALHQIASHSIELKLYVLDFFVRASFLVGDTQTWLGLTYEALLLRDLESVRYKWLRVSESEWLKFAEDSHRHHYYCISAQVCEKALIQLDKRLPGEVEVEGFDRDKIVAHASSLKEYSLKAAASGSVQAQALDHWKRKSAEQNSKISHTSEASHVASVLFRNGIKMRNSRNLNQSQKTRLKDC